MTKRRIKWLLWRFIKSKRRNRRTWRKRKKNELAKELNFNVDDAIKKDEEESQRLIKEENKKIEEQKAQEAKEIEQKNQSISIGNLEIPADTKIYKSQELTSSGSL